MLHLVIQPRYAMQRVDFCAGHRRGAFGDSRLVWLEAQGERLCGCLEESAHDTGVTWTGPGSWRLEFRARKARAIVLGQQRLLAGPTAHNTWNSTSQGQMQQAQAGYDDLRYSTLKRLVLRPRRGALGNGQWAANSGQWAVMGGEGGRCPSQAGTRWSMTSGRFGGSMDKGGGISAVSREISLDLVVSGPIAVRECGLGDAGSKEGVVSEWRREWVQWEVLAMCGAVVTTEASTSVLYHTDVRSR
ncbi:hypothetical protein CIB48_g8494 [Xylaria polymorpha]|nr:hypothetical protein CIB48_g8494 [Xylaria polymorpha]